MINKRVALIGLSLLLAGCGSLITSSGIGTQQARLAACPSDNTEFENLAFSKWPDQYHTTVAQVVEAHIGNLSGVSTERLQCTTSDATETSPPTDALRELAVTLPPWENDRAMASLSEADIGSVLFEYLRIYECSLNQRQGFLNVILSQKTSEADDSRSTYNDETLKERAIIARELAVARSSLDRTLLIVGSIDRLRPLTVEIECLKRTSLDIRNITGLIGQTAACLPRVRDARGSLHDLPDAP